jgi:hypothetical protein
MPSKRCDHSHPARQKLLSVVVSARCGAEKSDTVHELGIAVDLEKYRCWYSVGQHQPLSQQIAALLQSVALNPVKFANSQKYVSSIVKSLKRDV